METFREARPDDLPGVLRLAAALALAFAYFTNLYVAMAE
jgi:hypothetical protein